MKKYLSLLLLPFLFINNVNASTTINIQYGGSNYSELYYLNNLSWNQWYDYYDANNTPHFCNGKDDCYNQAISYFSSLNYSYYSMFVQIYPQSQHVELWLIPFNFLSNELMNQTVYSSGSSNISRYRFYITRNNTDYNTAILLDGFSDPYSNNFYMFYDSNYNFDNEGDYYLKGFYDNENDDFRNMVYLGNGALPKIKDLMEYTSWADYESNVNTNYTEVNLNDYEYVILSLKNYSSSEPFESIMYLKGQIGITPVYNFGQTSKDSITGFQVQDRCNLSYENYTSYPFYILQSDLQNNAIYYVKECEQNSSFKFDNTIFDITYVTQANLNTPTVTINGTTYNTIPYADLPSTATKNEENNYIPGQSGSATDTGGLDSAIKNSQQKMSEIWNTFTYFTSFVGQIFSALPTELMTVLLSAFTICVILGVIKIFTS